MTTASDRCYQAPHRDSAWCAIHDEPPDWGSEVRRPGGWWCAAGAMHFTEPADPVCRDPVCEVCQREEPPPDVDDSALRFSLIELA